MVIVWVPPNPRNWQRPPFGVILALSYPDINVWEANRLLRHIAALVFIFVCTTIAWVILGSTIMLRTSNSEDQLKGHVASTWGSAQEQVPPTANLFWSETVATTTKENGKTILRYSPVERSTSLPIDSTRLKVDLNLNHRQKGLLWYSTYAVDFAGDYIFRNDATVPGTATLRLPFPAQKAVYDGLTMTFNGQPVPLSIDEAGAASKLPLSPGQTAVLHVAYRSHGMDRWRYKLAAGIAQVHDFSLVMHTNFKDIDFADVQFVPRHFDDVQHGEQRVAVLLDLGPLMAVEGVLDRQVGQVELLVHRIELLARGLEQRNPDETFGLADVTVDFAGLDVGEFLPALVRDAIDQHEFSPCMNPSIASQNP